MPPAFCASIPVTNPYLTGCQLFDFYDKRTLIDMIGDDDSETLGVDDDGVDTQERLGGMIDDAAEDVEMDLSPSYKPPLTPMGGGDAHRSLKRMVAYKTIERLYARRGDKPEWVEKEANWYEERLERINKRQIHIPGLCFRNGPLLERGTPRSTWPCDPVRSITDSAIDFNK